MKAIGPRYLHHKHATDTEDIGPLYDDQSCRDLPQFMLPWAREEHHEENPVHPLFQAGAFGGDGDTCPSACTVGCGKEPSRGNCGEVDVENMLKHPTRLIINQLDRPHHQSINPFSNRPIIKCLPSQKEKMKTDNQQDKQTHVHRTTVFGVLAICLDVLYTHKKILRCEITYFMNYPYLCTQNLWK